MSFLGSIFKGIIGGVTGFVTGGPAGAVIGAATGLVGGKPQAGSAGGGVMPASPITRMRTPSLIGNALMGQPTGIPTIINRLPLSGMSMGGTASGSVPVASDADVAAASAALCMRGHHLNKSSYIVGKGSLLQHEVAKGSKCVKNRHMNPGNTVALRRALRRAYGFEKLAMRTIRLLHPHKPARFGGFKKRTRARR